MSKLLFLLTLTLALFGADINQSLIEANQSTYTALLKRLAPHKNESEERALQRALLERILNILHSSTTKEIALPKKLRTQKDYELLAKRYIQTVQTIEHLRSRIAQNGDLLENLRDRIAKLPSDANTTLTLQLQYTLYNKIDASMQRRIDQLQKIRQRMDELFLDSLPAVSFDTAAIQRSSKKLQESILSLKKRSESLELDKERYEILGKKPSVAAIENRLEKIAKQEKAIYQELLQKELLRFFAQLQSKDPSLFATQKEILKTAQSFDPSILVPLENLLQSMEKHYLGTATALKGWTLLNLKITLQKFWNQINEPLFSFGKTPISSFKLALALLAIFAGFLIGALYKRSIKGLKRSISNSTKTLLSNLGYYFFVLLGFFLSLNVLGVNLSSLTLIAGALSVGIGFGLQNIVSNFVSGLILMFERSVKIGDYVEIDDNLRGHVSDIRMRSTTITTNSNIDIIIPNQEFIQNRVINWTMNDKIRRFEIPFGVAYGTDIDKVRRVILEAVKRSGFDDLYEDPPRRITRVVMTGMGDSSVDFELFVWIKGREIFYPKRTTSRFLELIYKTLYQEGIEIPFPQRDIHIRSVDGEIPLHIRRTHGE